MFIFGTLPKFHTRKTAAQDSQLLILGISVSSPLAIILRKI
jgi:hypothetical protein